MSKKFELKASIRANAGKGASRRLRRQEDAVPAIIYGGDKAPTQISVDHKKLVHATENEAFFTSILTLDVDGQKESVIIKDLQRHPAKPRLIHADFQRVQADHLLTVKVPVHVLNETIAVGVKQGGGKVMHILTELEVSCLPKDLPEYIEVDVKDLNVGESLHISDLKLPQGVTSISLSHGESGNLAVVSIAVMKGSEEAKEGEAEGGADKK